MAVVIVAVNWFVFTRTAVGMQIRGRGQAPDAAKFSGIPVERLRFRSALVSDAGSGAGGASQVMGVQHLLTQGFSNSHGYTGVIVETLAGRSAVGVVLVAGLLADIAVGAEKRVARPPGADAARRDLRGTPAAHRALGRGVRHYWLARSGRRRRGETPVSAGEGP